MDGGVGIEIAANAGSYSFKETFNTTAGSVTLTLDPGGQAFTLTADPGVYGFFFTAINFKFSPDTVTWAAPGNQNVTWMWKDSFEFAMTNINFTRNEQTVVFTINPDNTFTDGVGQRLPPIDPTILNNPMPGGTGFVPQPAAVLARELVVAG
jgi:hypothetical protein